jgi:hypothetical protein
MLEILFRKFKFLYFQGSKGVYYVELVEESWLLQNFHSHLNLKSNIKTEIYVNFPYNQINTQIS